MEKKILLVDDKPENLVALEKLLEPFDATLIRALSGNEALTLTLEHEFALALIDVQMPVMDGYETVKLMRNVERTRLLPVIFVSAIYSDSHYQIQGIEAGAVDFIVKPIQPQMLRGKTRVFLELYEQRKALETEIELRKQIEISLRDTEVQLKLARDKAEAADQLKSAFLANMSHEIRTPLNAIVGFSNLMGEPDLSLDKRQQYVQYINNSSFALTALISDILDITKIEAGQLIIEKSNCELISILKELQITFAEHLRRLDKGGVSLRLNLPENATQIFLQTDLIRFRQVISNLVTNAIKFTLDGHIEIGIELPATDTIAVYVSDTGIGISPDKINLIFDRFQQVHSSKVINTSGVGLGLSIVKKIIDLLGGTITVSSQSGAGSTFSIQFPGPVMVQSQTETAPIQPTGTKVPLLSGKNILIVEDEESSYYVLAELLSLTHARLDWVRNGEAAVNAVRMSLPDLLLMDLKLPDTDGFEAFRRIHELYPQLPVVAQTAYAMSGEKEHILALGFHGYLSKPINRAELFVMLTRIFAK